MILMTACGPSSQAAETLALDVKVTPSVVAMPRRVVVELGDRVTARARGADQLWIYRDRVLVTHCPGSAACRGVGRGFEVDFEIDAAARYHVVAVDGAATLVPAGDFDGDVLAARALGARLELQSLQATPPSRRR